MNLPDVEGHVMRALEVAFRRHPPLVLTFAFGMAYSRAIDSGISDADSVLDIAVKILASGDFAESFDKYADKMNEKPLGVFPGSDGHEYLITLRHREAGSLGTLTLLVAMNGHDLHVWHVYGFQMKGIFMKKLELLLCRQGASRKMKLECSPEDIRCIGNPETLLNCLGHAKVQTATWAGDPSNNPAHIFSDFWFPVLPPD